MTYTYKAGKPNGNPKLTSEQCTLIMQEYKDVNALMLFLFIYQDVPDECEHFTIDEASVKEQYGLSIKKQMDVYNRLQTVALIKKTGKTYSINRDLVKSLLIQ